MFIGAIIGGVAALGGAAIASNAAKNAAKTSAKATDAATQLQYDQWQQTLTDNEPWRQAGQDSLNRLMGILTSGPYSSAKFTPGDLTQDPGYQFQLQEGMRAVDNSASARGGIGGAALKAGARFSQGLADTTYNNAFNRFQTERNNTLDPLFRTAGFGTNVNTQNSAAGQNYANQASQYGIGSAGYQGAAGMERANIWGNALNQGVAQWNRMAPNAMPVSPSYYPDYKSDANYGGGW